VNNPQPEPFVAERGRGARADKGKGHTIMSADKRPDILLIMPDQMRGDCLSLDGHPALLTPNADHVGGAGCFFRRAYSTCASCIPARRSLLTGQFPSRNGLVGFTGGCPIRAPTLPRVLLDGGYDTALVGRHMHQFPDDEPYGFATCIAGSTYAGHDEYSAMLQRAVPDLGGITGIGISFNGWQAKPWPLPEHLHPTSWAVRRAREYMAQRDTARPLFLVTSFFAPHPPLIPPAHYMERYLRTPLPAPAIGDWAVPPPGSGIGLGVDSPRVVLRGEAFRSARAGYFGLINHIDDQIYWLIEDFKQRSTAMKRRWLIVFTSDHGEMLGDHYLFRKCEPYEGSSRIPLLIQGSPGLSLRAGTRCDRPVCLEDIMPTVLELAGIAAPPDMDGKSLVPVLRGQADGVRAVLHAEHAPCYSPGQAYHFLTDGRSKYIWRPIDGSEQLFDLRNDPQECHDLGSAANRATELAGWRRRLCRQLAGRPEGFTDGMRLIPGRPYPAALPRARGPATEGRAPGRTVRRGRKASTPIRPRKAKSRKPHREKGS